MKCPSFEDLIGFLDEKLVPAEADRVARHLAEGCDQCASDQRWYRAVQSVTVNDDSVAPPAWVLKRALRIFETSARPGLAERVGQAIAALMFDSLARPALAGVRSTETATRQLLYRAEPFSVDLHVVPAEHAKLDVIGQVLRDGEAAFESVGHLRVELVRGDAVPLNASTNELGEFKLNGIDPGHVDLRIHVPDGSITISNLPIELP